MLYQMLYIRLTREAAARRRVSKIDAQSDRAQNGHGDNVESSSLDPSTEGRARIPCSSTTMLILAAKDAGLLLAVMGTGGCGCICGSSRVSLVEETHRWQTLSMSRVWRCIDVRAGASKQLATYGQYRHQVRVWLGKPDIRLTLYTVFAAFPSSSPITTSFLALCLHSPNKHPISQICENHKPVLIPVPGRTASHSASQHAERGRDGTKATSRCRFVPVRDRLGKVGTVWQSLVAVRQELV